MPEPRLIENAREAFAAEIARVNERIANVHTEQPCPRCGAATGERCMRVHRGRPMRHRDALKHPHQERIRAAGIPLR